MASYASLADTLCPVKNSILIIFAAVHRRRGMSTIFRRFP